MGGPFAPPGEGEGRAEGPEPLGGHRGLPENGLTNGAAEALNGIVQTVKRKSRGFRTFDYFRTMIYLVASHLKFDLPDPVPTTHTKSL